MTVQRTIVSQRRQVHAYTLMYVIVYARVFLQTTTTGAYMRQYIVALKQYDQEPKWVGWFFISLAVLGFFFMKWQ